MKFLHKFPLRPIFAFLKSDQQDCLKKKTFGKEANLSDSIAQLKGSD